MLVPAGPDVPMQMPDVAGDPRPAVGGVRAALLVADGEVADRSNCAARRRAAGSPRPGSRRRPRRPRPPARGRRLPSGSCGAPRCLLRSSWWSQALTADPVLRELLDEREQAGVVVARRAPWPGSARSICCTRPVTGSGDAVARRPSSSAMPRSLWCRSMRKPGVKSCSRKFRRLSSMTLLAASPPPSTSRIFSGSHARLRAEHERLADGRDADRRRRPGCRP